MIEKNKKTNKERNVECFSPCLVPIYPVHTENNYFFNKRNAFSVFAK